MSIWNICLVNGKWKERMLFFLIVYFSKCEVLESQRYKSRINGVFDWSYHRHIYIDAASAFGSYVNADSVKSVEKCKRYSVFYPEKPQLHRLLAFVYRPVFTSPIWQRRWNIAATGRSSQCGVYVYGSYAQNVPDTSSLNAAPCLVKPASFSTESFSAFTRKN